MPNSWIFRMAWRDSRGSRRQLALFLSSMIVGVAALVAISSFGSNLRKVVDDESKTLLGADLVFESGRPFGDAVEAAVDSIGGTQSRLISFPSMAWFPAGEQSRLMTVRAVEGNFPFYGEIETTPAGAADNWLVDGDALVDAAVMRLFDVQPGDSVRIGRYFYPVAGGIDKMPSENQMMSFFSPRVYIPAVRLDSTLLSRGSQADYELAFRFDDGRDVEALVENIGTFLREEEVRYDTVEEVRESWDEGLTNLYRFLNVIAFVAVLLGGIGVAGAIHVYVRRRLATIAVLRCLGAGTRQTFSVYAVQTITMGLASSVTGAVLGIGVQMLVPAALSDFLPVEVPFMVSWGSLGAGMTLGVGVTAAFALFPLVSIRRISPLLTLRSTVETAQTGLKDPLWWIVFGVVATGITVFSISNAPSPGIGLGYAAGLAAVFGALLVTAKGIIWATRRFFPSRWSYIWRQGLANLFRPNNQTNTLILSLGLGAFIIGTLFGIQRTLLAQLELSEARQLPNIVLFDIQPDEIDPVTRIVQGRELPVLDSVPIVSMRLASVNGRTVNAMRADSTATWAHRREYRVTYRDYLTESEKVVEGAFIGSADPNDPVAPISLDQDIARDLDVGLGDSLTFNVQGQLIPTRVSSLREVEWRRMGTNFFVVFPAGVLEEAPRFYVVLSRSETGEQAAGLQRAVLGDYPSVSVIDLSLVLSTFDTIFSRISFVVRFMAAFSILTAVIVLIGAVVVSRVQRRRESVLLKTLGASQSEVLRIMTVEYLFLGFFAALTGLALSFASVWAFSVFVFDTSFRPDVVATLVLLVAVPFLTVAIGLVNSRGIYRRSPLEVLRTDM
ncbi:MAG: FtsX-like permease family protein [Bacteroidetes bacterium SB0662_bin_6]|nr:FtsX-like permease family protein [Bacteroidetes bacterium SB0668_bin_1]MYE05015.1 FtsX-like permease family protein [Bacteroidetes bacterium SB0662_bin_6]